MITFGFAIAEHFIGANFSGWLYVLPVLMDLALIGRASVVAVKK
jgi:hypothetical protein